MANIGPKPKVGYMNKTLNDSAKLRLLIDKLLRRRELSTTAIMHTTDENYELTIGQIKMLQARGITLLMTDDLGHYEQIVGPGHRIIKRRL